MDRTEFLLATAGILFLAFCVGWFAHWLVAQLTRVSHDAISQLDTLSEDLQTAEEERDQAVHYLHQREAEMGNQLSQTEAELAAAMEGLRTARSEAEELRAYVERMNAS